MTKVYVSSLIDAPPDRVWQVIRDFNAMPMWHPLIAQSHIEEEKHPDQVGCVRNFQIKDGGRIREKLLALSDYDFTFTYSILESPLGVENYIATLKLTPVTDMGSSFAEWSAEFDCPPEREAELVATIGGDVFQGGFDMLKSRFSRP